MITSCHHCSDCDESEERAEAEVEQGQGQALQEQPKVIAMLSLGAQAENIGDWVVLLLLGEGEVRLLSSVLRRHRCPQLRLCDLGIGGQCWKSL